MSARKRSIDRRLCDSSRSASAPLSILALSVVLLFVVAVSSAGAAHRGNLTAHLRNNGNVTKNDTVEFGFMPSGLINPSTPAGSRLNWVVTDVTQAQGGAGRLSLTLMLDPVVHAKGLGARPAYRQETCVPYASVASPFDKWLNSDIAAWLNSASIAPIGIDYSLSSGGVEGYGFLQTAFNTEIIDSILIAPDPMYAMRVMVPDLGDLNPTNCDPDTITHNPGTLTYSLIAGNGNGQNQSRDLPVDAPGVALPVIKLYLSTPASSTQDWFNVLGQRTQLDEATIFGQPLSATYKVGPSDPLPPTLASVGAAIESEDTACSTDHVLYQWYQRLDSGAVVPVDANTGLALSPAVANPQPNAFEMKGTALAPGRYVFFCRVTHTNGISSVDVDTVDAVISLRLQQVAQIGCSECHTNNVRKLHEGYAGGSAGFCNLCHQLANQTWAGNDPYLTDFSNFNISCGIGDNACHSAQGAGGAYHGEAVTDVYDMHAITTPSVTIGDALGAPLTMPYGSLLRFSSSKPRVANTCGGTVYSAGCHAPDSIESNFYFGGMNLLAAHNDYAKAQDGIAQVSTDALGESGCLACHRKDLRPDSVTGCQSCHDGSNGSYPTGAFCFKPSVASMASASVKFAGTAGGAAKAQLGAPPVAISPDIIQLVGSLIGAAPDTLPLQAGVASVDGPNLSAGIFPLGSLLAGDTPLAF